MCVFQTARKEIAFAGAMQGEKMVVTPAGVQFVGAPIPFSPAVNQEVYLARKASKRGHYNSPFGILDDEL